MIESYSLLPSGMIYRQVRLADGRTVDTPMGTVAARAHETLDERADRAFPTSETAPERAGSRSALRTVDLYCGCGGLSLGLSEACRATGRGFAPVTAVDLDNSVLEIYARNFPGAGTVRADMTELIDGAFCSRLTASERELRRRIGRLDFLLAGPPCQGFSALNNHTRGDDPKNRLYERVARAAEVLEPDHVLIENVASVRSSSPHAVARPSRPFG